MKNKILLKLSFLLSALAFQITGVKAQWVTIPDPIFSTYLQSLFPNCMNGNEMDTTCYDIVNASNMMIIYQPMQSIEGIQYFDNLLSLDCSMNELTLLPSLPQSLVNLKCDNNQITSMVSFSQSLKYIACNDNQISSLPILPDSLEEINCSSNLLTSLPMLPEYLTNLYCNGNQITTLPTLPEFLKILSCGDNPITSLPFSLPQSLTYLNCTDNYIPNLPELPSNLQSLTCSFIGLTYLPSLPQSLKHLECGYNQITELPELSDSLLSLYCQYNNLTFLPELPNSIAYLFCEGNNLTNLPELPDSLIILYCEDNLLFEMPQLPETLTELWCNGNNIYCFKNLPDQCSFIIYDNPFSCLPNYTEFMVFNSPLLLNYPLCEENDTINNPNNCDEAKGIKGNLYQDFNANCFNDPQEQSVHNIPMKLYDQSNNLIATYFSLPNGVYNFYLNEGSYLVQIDTLNKPYTISCEEVGIDSLVVLDENNQSVNNIDFAIKCKPGIDLTMQSIVQTGLVFPGQQHQVSVFAGDIGSWYNLNCADGIGGEVKITVSGSLIYDGTPNESIIPTTVSGNTFIYDIANFDTTDINNFNLLFITDTSAQAGEEICVTASINPIGLDNDTSNNNMSYCYPIANSFDPNDKQVYPTSVLPDYNGYFIYTIHFQNTGNAPAINIKIQDTLNTYLDVSTFEIISYSHMNSTLLSENLITFRFNSIFLPDSTSDLQGSKGYIQYRIKPLSNLPAGTQITNTAYIYFDYNEPIQTNTTESNFEILSNLNTYQKNKINIYPNPSSGLFTIDLKEKSVLTITNILGETLLQQEFEAGKQNINIQDEANGIYFVRVFSNGEMGMVKILKE